MKASIYWKMEIFMMLKAITLIVKVLILLVDIMMRMGSTFLLPSIINQMDLGLKIIWKTIMMSLTYKENLILMFLMLKMKRMRINKKWQIKKWDQNIAYLQSNGSWTRLMKKVKSMYVKYLIYHEEQLKRNLHHTWTKN